VDGAAVRDPAAGGPQYHPAAAQRLHQPAEGHRAGRRARIAIEANKAARSVSSTVFNYSSYAVAAILFLILTIPLARFTDHLIARDRRGVSPEPSSNAGRERQGWRTGHAGGSMPALRVRRGLRKSFGPTRCSAAST
jgi:hypothetical protein